VVIGKDRLWEKGKMARVLDAVVIVKIPVFKAIRLPFRICAKKSNAILISWLALSKRGSQ